MNHSFTILDQDKLDRVAVYEIALRGTSQLNKVSILSFPFFSTEWPDSARYQTNDCEGKSEAELWSPASKPIWELAH